MKRPCRRETTQQRVERESREFWDEMRNMGISSDSESD